MTPPRSRNETANRARWCRPQATARSHSRTFFGIVVVTIGSQLDAQQPAA